VTSHRANPDNLDFNLAATGAVLEWSLMYPGISVQKLLGSSTSVSTVRAPSVRYKIYSELLTTAGTTSEVNISKAHQGFGYARPDGATLSMLRDMEDQGLLSLNSKKVTNNPQIQVIDPAYKSKQIKLEDAKKRTQALYAVMEKMYKDSEQLPLEEMLNRVLILDPDADLPMVRRTILIKASGRKGNGGLAFVDDNYSSPQTNIVINSDLSEAIETLLSMLESVRNGDAAERYLKRAKEVINSPSLTATLMQKAKEFSPFVASRERTQGLGQTILSVIDGSEELLSSAEIRERMLRDYGVDVQSHTVNTKLRGLVASGRILRQLVETKDGKIRKIKKFSKRSTHN